ncbi:GIY-YIG nuclease family protein [Vibrio sp. TH_r3]|uniref:GIY-YIG nuclease family protein n=1 Tax=Vibrio sp. TH_r3 TaxID=3082084 RepID=UPI002952D027|nr:GIY-YIG nuclease family protein [Vibrio sp. TH_r3]MDV7103443.1 GIY-YIG nuclease family protein [Vibrio sp. TH_r3]
MNVSPSKGEGWWVYLIRNKNNALYCGITNDLSRRFRMHQQGKGAKALRGKGPLTLEWSQLQSSKSLALKLEHRIKKMKKVDKEHLVKYKSEVSI